MEGYFNLNLEYISVTNHRTVIFSVQDGSSDIEMYM